MVTVIGVLEGIAATCGIGGLAVGPVVMLISAWRGYWRLRPLWAVVQDAVPDAGLPARPGSRLSIRRRLPRRVNAIRAAPVTGGRTSRLGRWPQHAQLG